MPSSPATAALALVCPNGWQVLPLADVAYFQEGPGILAKDFREAGVPLLRLKGVEGDYVTLDGCNYLDPEMVARKWDHFRVEEGDLLISTSASLGRVSVVTSESKGGVPYTGLIRFKPKDPRLLAGYLKTFLGSAAFVEQAESMASGSVIRHFGPSHIRQMAILVPPLDQQVRIGELATLLDERLRLLRQTNATLESIAQALFKSWFIDFDPVRAKAEGREPEGMDAATAALFPSEFEESALGLIPKGWKVRRIEELAAKVAMGPFGSNIKVSTFVDSGVPVISGQHLRGALLEDNVFNFIAEEHAQRLAGALVRPGDIVLTHAGNIGQVALIPSDAAYQTYVLSQRQFYLRCNSDVASAEHLMYFLRSSAGQHVLLANTSQVGVPSIARPASYLKSIQLVAPPVHIARAFAEHAHAVHLAVGAGRKRIALLEQLRDTLLPRLISGKLRLPEAQAQLEDALA